MKPKQPIHLVGDLGARENGGLLSPALSPIRNGGEGKAAGRSGTLKATCLLVGFLAAGSAAAETGSAGLLNDWLPEQVPGATPFDLGGQVRFRFESKDYMAVAGTPGAVDFRAASSDPHNSYFLLREKIHLGYTASPWLRVFVEGRDSSSTGDDRNPNPDSDSLDLHQAFVSLGDPAQFPVTLKVGRQELSYGDERLIGPSDWLNIPRTFDALKARFENEQFWVDAFTSRPVLANDDRFNVSNDYEYFSGIYGSTKALVPKNETQLYFLARNVEKQSPAATTGSPQAGGASPRDIYTVGARVKSLPGSMAGWDYQAEAAGQFGRFKFAPAAKSLSQQAYALSVLAGYTWENTASHPRLGLEYNFASGDSNPADGRHGTFDNLYPTNHRLYGFMDFVSWQNINDLRLTASCKPVTGVTLTADLHGFWLADTRDFFYDVKGAARTTGGYGINPAANNYLGSELDLTASYAFRNWGVAQAGYGHFFAENFIQQSLSVTGGRHDADWLYLQMTLNF